MTVSELKSKVAARKATEVAVDKAIAAMNLTGMTHDGSIEPTSTRAIPCGDEIRIVEHDGIVEVQRVLPSGPVILGGTKVKKAKELVETWVAAYRKATLRDRATKFLQVDDPMSLLATQEATLKANGVPNSDSSYQRKTKMEVSEESSDVLVGGTSKVKRVTWRGHGGFALARALGHLQLTGGQAVKVFAAIKMPLGKTAIIGGVYSGRKGERGAPAQLTEADMLILTPLINEAKKAEPVVVKEKKLTSEAKPVILAKVPIAELPGMKGSKANKAKEHDAKVLKEMAKRKAAGARK